MLMRLTEGCKELGVSTTHGRRMVKNRHWPCYRLGPRAIRIDPEEIRRIAKIDCGALGSSAKCETHS